MQEEEKFKIEFDISARRALQIFMSPEEKLENIKSGKWDVFDPGTRRFAHHSETYSPHVINLYGDIKLWEALLISEYIPKEAFPTLIQIYDGHQTLRLKI